MLTERSFPSVRFRNHFQEIFIPRQKRMSEISFRIVFLFQSKTTEAMTLNLKINPVLKKMPGELCAAEGPSKNF